MNPARMPKWAVNDIGGTGTTNVKHWEQNMLTGRFASFARPGKPAQDYPVEKLAHSLNNTDLMIFVGENDALSQPGDV